VATLPQFSPSYSQNNDCVFLAFSDLDLTLGQGHSKSNRSVPGLCPAIPQNFIKIGLVVFE